MFEQYVSVSVTETCSPEYALDCIFRFGEQILDFHLNGTVELGDICEYE